jgi:hypothetical protein
MGIDGTANPTFIVIGFVTGIAVVGLEGAYGLRVDGESVFEGTFAYSRLGDEDLAIVPGRDDMGTPIAAVGRGAVNAMGSPR